MALHLELGGDVKQHHTIVTLVGFLPTRTKSLNELLSEVVLMNLKLESSLFLRTLQLNYSRSWLSLLDPLLHQLDVVGTDWELHHGMHDLTL